MAEWNTFNHQVFAPFLYLRVEGKRGGCSETEVRVLREAWLRPQVQGLKEVLFNGLRQEVRSQQSTCSSGTSVTDYRGASTVTQLVELLPHSSSDKDSIVSSSVVVWSLHILHVTTWALPGCTSFHTHPKIQWVSESISLSLQSRLALRAILSHPFPYFFPCYLCSVTSPWRLSSTIHLHTRVNVHWPINPQTSTSSGCEKSLVAPRGKPKWPQGKHASSTQTASEVKIEPGSMRLCDSSSTSCATVPSFKDFYYVHSLVWTVQN